MVSWPASDGLVSRLDDSLCLGANEAQRIERLQRCNISLLRRAPQWSDAQVRQLLAAYLEQPEDSALVATWYQRLTARRSHKENR